METRYSRAQKDQALEAFRKQIENGEVSSGEMLELSKKLNISVTTLYGWKVKLKKELIKGGDLKLETSKFTSKEKFQAVVDTSSMSELELGEYLRKHGILKEELDSWKTTMEDTFNYSSKANIELKKDLAKEKESVKKLEKELKRKNEALAETAALLVLQKKVQAIWGGTGED